MNRAMSEGKAALLSIVGNAVDLVVDDVRACRRALEAAEPKARQRAIERWGAEDAWKEFAPDSLIRLEALLTIWGMERT